MPKILCQLYFNKNNLNFKNKMLMLNKNKVNFILRNNIVEDHL